MGTADPEMTSREEPRALSGRSEFGKLRNYIFGSTAAIITNTSLIVGLGSAGSGRGPILGGLLTIALADNISDSMGIHLYKEAEGAGVRLSVVATVLNFLARLVVSMSFIAITMVLPLAWSVPVAVAWGLTLLVAVSYLINRRNRRRPGWDIARHLAIAVAVIVMSRYAGQTISGHFQ